MKRLLLALCLGGLPPWAAGESWLELNPSSPYEADGAIEVVEFFWYGCPHCHSFEPHLDRWSEQAADDVRFQRVPAVSSKSWIPHARAYYTAMSLGVLDQHHQALFDAIHQAKRPILDAGQLRSFFVGRGVDEDEYQRTYESDTVDQRTKKAYLLGRDYKIRGVPALVVDGRYLTSPSMAGGAQQAIAVLQQLIERAREHRQDAGLDPAVASG